MSPLFRRFPSCLKRGQAGIPDASYSGESRRTRLPLLRRTRCCALAIIPTDSSIVGLDSPLGRGWRQWPGRPLHSSALECEGWPDAVIWRIRTRAWVPGASKCPKLDQSEEIAPICLPPMTHAYIMLPNVEGWKLLVLAKSLCHYIVASLSKTQSF